MYNQSIKNHKIIILIRHAIEKTQLKPIAAMIILSYRIYIADTIHWNGYKIKWNRIFSECFSWIKTPVTAIIRFSDSLLDYIKGDIHYPL